MKHCQCAQRLPGCWTDLDTQGRECLHRQAWPAQGMESTLACLWEIWSPAYLQSTMVRGHFLGTTEGDFPCTWESVPVSYVKFHQGWLGTVWNAGYVYEASCLHWPDRSLIIRSQPQGSASGSYDSETWPISILLDLRFHFAWFKDGWWDLSLLPPLPRGITRATAQFPKICCAWPHFVDCLFAFWDRTLLSIDQAGLKSKIC